MLVCRVTPCLLEADLCSDLWIDNGPTGTPGNLREDGYALNLGERADISKANTATSPFTCYLGNPSGVFARL